MRAEVFVRRKSTHHVWQFFRAGDFDQVAITSGADLLALGELDQKLWAALGCPVLGLHFDQRTLELIDSDGDGRVRAKELIDAVKWAAARLKTADDLVNPQDALPLESIDDSSEAGAATLAAARHVLALREPARYRVAPGSTAPVRGGGGTRAALSTIGIRRVGTRRRVS